MVIDFQKAFLLSALAPGAVLAMLVVVGRNGVELPHFIKPNVKRFDVRNRAIRLVAELFEFFRAHNYGWSPAI